MSSSFPNGTIFSVGTTLAAAKTITSITNANPGVAASTAHGYSAGDIVLLSMPSRLDQRVARVVANASPTNLFNLEGIDTTSTTLFPTGFGVGTSQAVTGFTSLSQVTDVQASGGDQQFYQWTYLEDGRQRQRPTFKSARSLSLQLSGAPRRAVSDDWVDLPNRRTRPAEEDPRVAPPVPPLAPPPPESASAEGRDSTSSRPAEVSSTVGSAAAGRAASRVPPTNCTVCAVISVL